MTAANADWEEGADVNVPVIPTKTSIRSSSNSKPPTNHITFATNNNTNNCGNTKDHIPMASPASSKETSAMTDSNRSLDVSYGSIPSHGSSSKATSTPGLRDNLMRRQQKDRNPAIYYETIKLLGFGSMGSVTKVKKRDAVVGGSSRENYVSSIHGLEGMCFSLPIIGSILRHCTGKNLGRKVKRNLFVDSYSASTSTTTTTPNTSRHSQWSASTNNSGSSTTKSSTISYGRKEIFYALKTIIVGRVKDPAFVQELHNEIDILKTLDHPNIVRPIETFHYRDNACIVMELCQGGNLFSRDPYTEAGALSIVTSVLSAIEYMHSKNIVHRDLKFENILFCDKRPDSDVKIIDFGLSKKYLPSDRLHEGCGTIYSMAPEVLRGDYNQAADLWSLGVIAFMLLASQLPFYGWDRKTVIRKILAGDFYMRGPKWRKTSKQAKDFVRKLLVLDPNHRPSAREALQDDWICQVLSTNSEHYCSQAMNEMGLAMASIEIFASYSKLKKLALMVIAHKATSEEIGFLRRIFDKYDKNHNGAIDPMEFREALKQFGYSEEESDNIFIGCDLDGTGVIHYTEFLAATIEAQGAICEEALAEAFDRMDSDDTGYISTHNLKEILGAFVPSESIEGIILEAESELDYSEKMKRQIAKKPAKDHFISYEEFMALWNQQQEEKRMRAFQKLERRRADIVASTKNNGSSLESIQESVPMNNITIDFADDLDAGDASDISVDADPVATLQFQGEKAMSVRKFANV